MRTLIISLVNLKYPENKKVEEKSGAIFEVEYGTQLFYENLMSISKGRKQLYFWSSIIHYLLYISHTLSKRKSKVRWNFVQRITLKHSNYFRFPDQWKNAVITMLLSTEFSQHPSSHDS